MLALLALEVFHLIWLIGGQEALVYVGTGVNDRMENRDNDVIVLGGLFPVHDVENNQCGDVLDTDIQRLEGMVLATQKINDNHSILPGVTLAFEIRDTCAQANIALEQSLKYVSARSLRIGPGTANGTILGISGVVGAAFSRTSTAVARLLRLFKVPQISYASTANILSDKTIFDYFLRTIPPDSLQARAMADIVEHFNWTYVIAMHTGDIYGSEGIRAFIDELGKRNSSLKCIATSSIEIPEVATTDDFDRAVKQMNQEWVSNATVVVLFGQRDTAIGLLKAVRQKMETDPNFASKNFTWIGSDGWGDRVPAELYEIAQGSLSVIPRSFVSNEFDNYFQSLNPLNYSANPWFREYWESIFNCSLGNRPGLKECDLANQVISPMSGYRQNGFVTFSIDAVYAFAHAVHKLQRDFCRGGPGLCQAILDTRSGGVAIQGELLLEYLHNVSFSGMSTGVISFDSNGDQQGGYVVKNLKKNSDGGFVFEVIGHWDEVPLKRSTPLEIYGNIQWSHGRGNDIPRSLCSHPCGNGEYPEPIADQVECCWICRPCPGTNAVSTGLACRECERGYTPNDMKTECALIQPSYLMWSHGWAVVILILTCSGIIATTAVTIIFTVYHKHQLIKASSRELSVVLLSGIMLCYLIPFFFIAKPSPWICAVRRFGVGFCFATCYSALLVKTNRIHRIFNQSPNSSQNPPLISPQSQLFLTSLLVAVQVVIALIWLVIERPSITHVFYQFSTELKCGESPHIGLSITLGYNFLLLLVTLYFAFRTRKVPQKFNETKFINFTVYTLCILWFAFIPTYFATTARLGTIYQTGSLVLAIILNATVTLCILFLPKIFYLLFTKQTESQSDPMTSLNLKHIDKPISFMITSLPLSTNSVMSAHQGTSQTQKVSVLTTENERDKKSCKQTHTGDCTDSAGLDGLQASGGDA